MTLNGEYNRTRGDAWGASASVKITPSAGKCFTSSQSGEGKPHKKGKAAKETQRKWEILSDEQVLQYERSILDWASMSTQWVSPASAATGGLPTVVSTKRFGDNLRIWSGQLPKHDLGLKLSEVQACKARHEDLIGCIKKTPKRPKLADGSDDMSGSLLFEVLLAPEFVKGVRPSPEEVALLLAMAADAFWAGSLKWSLMRQTEDPSWPPM